jgi:hypothetical protein
MKVDREDAEGTAIALIAGAIVVGLIVVIGIVGWVAGWWFKEQNTTREDKLYDKSYGRQEALKDQIVSNIGTVNDISADVADPSSTPAQVGQFTAQRKSIVITICRDASKLNDTNPMPDDVTSWVHKNCMAGTINPQSEYNIK